MQRGYKGFTIRVVWVLLALFGAPAAAKADVVAECGASEGYGYYMAGGAVSEERAGWSADGVVGGKIILRVDNDGKPQVTFRGADGRLQDVEGQGGQAVVVHSSADAGVALILVVYPGGVIEHYLFRIDKQGNGEVVWGTTRATGPIVGAKLFRAACGGNE